MTAPDSYCVLCACIYGRMRRALPIDVGAPALCVECRRSCDRGDGAAEAERRISLLPPPDAGAALMMRCGMLAALDAGASG